MWKVEGEAGSPVYHEDDSATLIYLLIQGRVRLYYRSGEGRRITLEFLDDRELFGELALADLENRGVAAETIRPSTLFVAPARSFQRLMDDSHQFTKTMLRVIAQRRWKLQSRLKSLIFDDARKRLIYVLLDLAEFEESDPVELGYTHQELADMAGLARPTTTKILNQLEDESILELGQGMVTLPTRQSLQVELGSMSNLEE